MTHLWVVAIVGNRGSRERAEKLGAIVVPGGKAKISDSISCRCMYHATACVWKAPVYTLPHDFSLASPPPASIASGTVPYSSA